MDYGARGPTAAPESLSTLNELYSSAFRLLALQQRLEAADPLELCLQPFQRRLPGPAGLASSLSLVVGQRPFVSLGMTSQRRRRRLALAPHDGRAVKPDPEE